MSDPGTFRFSDFKVLTFDCYGTLIDWETGILAVLRPWAEKTGLAAGDEELLRAFAVTEAEMERMLAGVLYRDVLRRVMDEISIGFRVAPSPGDADALAASVGKWPPFPDTVEALRSLKRRYKLAVISNVDHASFAGTDKQLGIDFDLVVTAEDAGAYKPDQRPFLLAFEHLEQMGIAREEILHVAQSLFHDHLPAKALGLSTVWVDRRKGKQGWGATPPPDAQVEPDLIVADLLELAALPYGLGLDV
jgi:2-haloacid dehalogenase